MKAKTNLPFGSEVGEQEPADLHRNCRKKDSDRVELDPVNPVDPVDPVEKSVRPVAIFQELTE